MSKMLVLIALMGCVDTPDESETEQFDLNTAVVNSCLWSGGSYWCQDYYSKRWCTNAHFATTWDAVDCTWSGWNAAGEYCGNPTYYPNHEYGLAHDHCD